MQGAELEKDNCPGSSSFFSSIPHCPVPNSQDTTSIKTFTSAQHCHPSLKVSWLNMELLFPLLTSYSGYNNVMSIASTSYFLFSTRVHHTVTLSKILAASRRHPRKITNRATLTAVTYRFWGTGHVQAIPEKWEDEQERTEIYTRGNATQTGTKRHSAANLRPDIHAPRFVGNRRYCQWLARTPLTMRFSQAVVWSFPWTRCNMLQREAHFYWEPAASCTRILLDACL